MADNKTTTKQVKHIPNPTGKGGFKERPQDRHNGAWKKEDTPRFKLERMMKLTPEELNDIVNDPATPLFDVKLAKAIKGGEWRILDGMINQVYGKPKESVDLTTQGESINPYAALSTEELRKLAGS